MKKIVFAGQVFAFAAMLPVIVILQMNHHLPKQTVPPDSDKTEKMLIKLAVDPADKIFDGQVISPLETFLLKASF